MRNRLILFYKKILFYKNAEAYSKLPFIRRIFTKKPSDPTTESLSAIFMSIVQILKDRYGFSTQLCDGESIVRVVTFAKFMDDGRIVLTARVYDGACYHEDNKVLLPDGAVNTLPIRYPYSECGICGLTRIPEGVLSKKQQNQLAAFRIAVRELKATIDGMRARHEIPAGL